MINITAPVTTFGIAIYREKATMSMQVPPGMVLFHANASGEHWKRAPKVLARLIRKTENPTKQAVVVNVLLAVVNTRT